MRPTGRFLLALACASALLAPSGCGPGARERRLVDELARLAFVPSGRCSLEDGLVQSGEFDLRTTLGIDAPLLVDRFEATRADWLHHLGAPPSPGALADPLARTPRATREGERLAWPAFCDLEEARAFAEVRGMRLLTAGEWMYVAAGSGMQRFPWGKSRRQSVANTLELGLVRPVAVGTFESGRSASGCYDLVGNVMEWVEGSLPPSSGVEWVDPAAPSAMGGSYLLRMEELWTATPLGASGRSGFACVPLSPRSRSVDLGVRCAAEAESYLRANLPRLVRDAATGERLVEIGEGWGRASLALLEGLFESSDDGTARWALERLLEGARR